MRLVTKLATLTAIMAGASLPFNVMAGADDVSVQVVIDKTCPTRTPCTTEGHLVVKNNTQNVWNQWQLGFNSVFPFAPTGANIKLTHNLADYYILSDELQPVLNPGNSVTIPFTIAAPVTHETDIPQGFFVKSANLSQPIDLAVATSLPVRPLVNAFAANAQHLTQRIEGNPLIYQPADQVLITPRPASITVIRNLKFTLSPNTVIKADPAAMAAAQFFVENTKAALGYSLRLEPYQTSKSTGSQTTGGNFIVLTTQDADKTVGPEGYTLLMQPQLAVIRATTAAGFFYGIESLRQLFPPQIFAHTVQTNVTWTAPAVNIKDYPRFSYRGVHLDVARHFYPPEQIKRLLDLMALNKLNVFHWHLADDEGWRIQINGYPQLTNIGAYRGYDLPLQPTLGSGAAPYGGYYTQQEVRDIVAYAAQRHIMIVPEIDTPGHARALIRSFDNFNKDGTNPLEDPQDQSQYTSIQGYHDNVVSPCVPGTYVVMRNIIQQVAELFPGPYIHVGGDEVPRGAAGLALKLRIFTFPIFCELMIS